MASRGGDTSMFPWLEPTKNSSQATNYNKSAADEVANRAGLLYRLGFSEKDATERLCARLGWEFDPACGGKRPASLSDDAIGKIVSETYARRPK